MINNEQYLLTKLMEECAEVTKECAKAIRFGLTSTYPGSSVTNADNIATELLDLIVTAGLLEANGSIKLNSDPQAAHAVVQKTHKYMLGSKDLGILE